MDPKTLELLTKYYKSLGYDTAEIADNLALAAKYENILKNEVQEAQEAFSKSANAASSLASSIKDSVQSLSKGDTNTKALLGSFRKLDSIASKFKYDMLDYSTMSKKEIENNITKIKQNNSLISGMLKQRQIQGEAAAEARSVLALSKELLVQAEERLKEEIKIQQTLGISGKIIDGIVGSLNKLGISSQFFENLKEDMREAAKSGSKWQVFSVGIKGVVKGIGEALKDPVTQLTLLLKLANFFVQAALTANTQSVALGKSLGYGASKANDFREKLADIEYSSNNINVTTKNLVEAYGELAKATGFAYEFTADQLTTQIKLTKQVGLQADEAAQIQRFGVLNGKTSEETYRSFLKGITAARNQLKVGIDFKATLAEASKVSGQLAAQLGNNPELIGKAIVSAKALGMTLEQVSKAGSTLLDFGTSISNELEAELLTGKEINLERARAAALAGDQVTLAEELAKNMGTTAEFTKLNKLQQDSLAKSVGMTSDELAETLKKREEAIASGKSLAQITEEEAKKALERQSIQDKFNAAVEKLQSLFGNLMAGPLGSFIDMLSSALNIVNSIMTPLKIIGGIWLGIVATKKIALGYDIAMQAANQISANLGLAQIGTNRVKVMLEKESLLTRIAGNIQLFRQLVAEQGVMAALKIQFGLQQANKAVKEESLLITIKDWLYEKGKTIWQAIQKTGIVAINALKSVGAIISKREALFSIAGAAMGALKAAVSGIGSLLGPLAIPIGIAAATGVAALGYNLLKGDDVMSEGGYGKRTLLSPEGAIKLNDKDTVIAGTNLGGGASGGSSMPQIDLTPMIMAINEVRSAVDRLYSKDQSINMDGKKVGTTLVQGSYKVA